MELLGVIVSVYKSAKVCEVPLSGLTVSVGPNGVGKSNLIEAVGDHDLYGRLWRHGSLLREP